jgi:hypothetical protein
VNVPMLFPPHDLLRDSRRRLYPGRRVRPAVGRSPTWGVTSIASLPGVERLDSVSGVGEFPVG